MGDVIFLVLRRLRAPLITVIAVYAISVGGLALIPAVDADGNPGRMSIFHAFYVMSYTATTIGFGEIPQPFTDAQRLWVTFAIYLSVIGWAYALGSVVALVNDLTFRAAAARGLFAWRVRHVAEPFYIVCGYGQSGSRLAHSLDQLGNRLIIIEPRPERIARVGISDYSTTPLTLVADARLADILEAAGIRSPHCQALIALAGEDEVNQAIAIGARLLNAQIQIVARAKSSVAQVNLESFGGVQVVNPFETFATNLGVSLRDPETLQIEDWLTSPPGSPCPAPIAPPRGRWLLIGWGRFGQAISKVLDREGIEWKAIDPAIEGPRDERVVRGDYAEDVLRDAGIGSADALVAGADVDAVNLGMTTLARRVKPDMFVVIRQNHMQDRALIEAARADVAFVQSDLMVHECLQLLKTPTLGRFIVRLRDAGADGAAATMKRIRDEVGDGAPSAWTFGCNVMDPGMFAAFFQNAANAFRIGHLLKDPTDPQVRLRVAALMLERGGTFELLPDADLPLKPADRILFVGHRSVRQLQMRFLIEPGTVFWTLSGAEPPSGHFFRWWRRRFGGI
jgi:Trk K+ transport system NAD-binding subunit